jgi:hypothetical protein
LGGTRQNPVELLKRELLALDVQSFQIQKKSKSIGSKRKQLLFLKPRNKTVHPRGFFSAWAAE